MNKIILKEPKFIPNTDDDTHCVQACFAMSLSVLKPTLKFSLEELDQLSGKNEYAYTWPNKLIVELADRGLKFEVVEEFDYDKFLESPEQYLIDEFGQEVGEDQIKKSDLPSVIKASKEMLRKPSIIIKNREPFREDILMLLKRGYYILCNVNQMILQNDPGYVGHFILIYGINDKGCLTHNPGSPAKKSEWLSWETFEKAWAYPDKTGKNIIAIK